MAEETQNLDMLDIPTAENIPDSPANVSDAPEVAPDLMDDILAPTISDPPADTPDVPSTPIIETETPVVEEESSIDTFDYASLTEREKALIARLEEVTGDKIALSFQQQQNPTPTVESTPAGNIDFLSNIDIDEVLQTAEGFNGLLNIVYQRALSDAKAQATEHIMRSLPESISTHYQEHATRTKIVEDFYGENPDLVHIKRTVAAIANELAANNPTYTLDQILKESAVRTRQMLGLRKSPITAPASAAVPSKPAFVGQRSSGNRVKAPELVGIEAEVAELIKGF